MSQSILEEINDFLNRDYTIEQIATITGKENKNEIRKQIIKRAIENNGEGEQLVKLLEEMNELGQVVCKFLATGDEREIENIIEETADVTITLNELDLIVSEYRPTFMKEVRKMIDYKLDRLNKRLNGI